VMLVFTVLTFVLHLMDTGLWATRVHSWWEATVCPVLNRVSSILWFPSYCHDQSLLQDDLMPSHVWFISSPFSPYFCSQVCAEMHIDGFLKLYLLWTVVIWWIHIDGCTSNRKWTMASLGQAIQLESELLPSSLLYPVGHFSHLVVLQECSFIWRYDLHAI
jgi:hypothetical protein